MNTTGLQRIQTAVVVTEAAKGSIDQNEEAAVGTSRVVLRLNSLFAKPHLLGWAFNMAVVLVVAGILASSYLDEHRNNERVLERTAEVAAQIFSPSRAAYRSRTQQTSELNAALVSRAWPLVIHGSERQRADALMGIGPLVDDYNQLDAEWSELRSQLEADVPSDYAMQLINAAARRWVAENTFYENRVGLFWTWIALVVIYSVFVFRYVMPQSRGSGKTESLLLLVDAGLYFTVISWFTKTEIPGLGWIILAPASIVFFEVFKNLLDNHKDRGVYLAGVLFMFFLFFGVLQLRVEYNGANFGVSSGLAALEDFFAYVIGAALVAALLTFLFKYVGRVDPEP